MLIKQHAVELSAHGITVNGIAPTVVRGDMGSHWLTNPETRQHILQRIPLGRVAEACDLASAVVFFCGPGASFVTGQVLYIDGGLTALLSNVTPCSMRIEAFTPALFSGGANQQSSPFVPPNATLYFENNKRNFRFVRCDN